MSKHFLALIGTSLYEPILYYEDAFTSSEQEFIQLQEFVNRSLEEEKWAEF